MQNAFVESFNGRLWDECLKEHIFGNLDEARKIIENWRIEYTHHLAGRLRPSTPISNVPHGLPRMSSAHQALTETISTERNRNGFHT